ncbi:hypothetical protein PT974_05805 [Cladobotryum mycophilum]|uniref:Uncharacterized protein n=1 Tax=Cladobotryum mycophilum TaxID=491253 RepID=A0ABR0SKS2_9HYPO
MEDLKREVEKRFGDLHTQFQETENGFRAIMAHARSPDYRYKNTVIGRHNGRHGVLHPFIPLLDVRTGLPIDGFPSSIDELVALDSKLPASQSPMRLYDSHSPDSGAARILRCLGVDPNPLATAQEKRQAIRTYCLL